MHELLPFIVAGVASGSIYGLAASGLVLTYKTSGIFNFGHGATATAAAYLFYSLHYANRVGWVPSFMVAVIAAGPVLGVGMEQLSRRLAQQTVVWKIVATVGLILIVQGLGTVKYGGDTIRVAQFLPGGTKFFRIAGVNVSYPQLTVAIVGATAVGALYVLFRFTRTGTAMRAVVDDADLLAMQATNPIRIRRAAWIIGSSFAAGSGVLVLPFVGLNAIALTFLVVQAFGAAALGAFNSIPLTFVGAILLEIAANISQKYVVNVNWLSGLPDSLPFVVLFAALLVLPRHRLVPPSVEESRPTVQWRSPLRVRLTAAVIVVGVLTALPPLVGDRIGFFTVGLTQVIMLLSLGLLVKTSGQVSLCHAAFAAIGAVAFSQLTVHAGIPWFAALVLAALIVVPVGALVAVPATRLSGLFLALATFGFGIFVQQMLYARSWMFTTLVSGRAVPRPSVGADDRTYYYLVLALAVVAALVMVAIHEGRLGRVLRGLSDSPVAVTTMGLSTNTTRVIVFCTSAFFAGLAGILYAGSVHFAVASDVHFMALNSLTLLALLALAPLAEPWYALFGLGATIVPAYLTSPRVDSWLNAFFGLSAIAVAVQGGHPAMPLVLRSHFERFGRTRNGVPAPVMIPAADVAVSRGEKGLEVVGLRVEFGGLVAVDGLNLSAPMGRITGLIGPNGAGKTSTFNACSGLNRRVKGRISLRGADITRLGAAARGRKGLGRTFQKMALCDRLTVAENVALGRESALAGGNVFKQMFASRSERAETNAAAWSAMQLCGITELAGVQAGALSTGQRRLVELARCVAGRFDVLILDEPSSGLDRSETQAVEAILRRIVAERGSGVLLVEHDMGVVMSVCDYLYVLDFGKLTYEGTPSEVAASPVVRAAYLGFHTPSTAVVVEEAG